MVTANGTDRLLSRRAIRRPDAVARYNVPIPSATTCSVQEGTLILGATNTFTGMLTIESGVYAMRRAQRLGLGTTRWRWRT